MEDLFGIQTRRQGVAENIQKALGAGYEPEGTDENTNIQKGRVGVYEDNAENRRLNRVGQQYGKKKEEKQPKGKVSTKKEDEPSDKKGASEKQDMSSHAAKASDGALKRAAADEKAPEDVRNAAKEELKKRGGESEDKGDKNWFTEDGSLNKNNPTVKRMWELDKKLGEHPDKNSDEFKEYNSLRKRFDYEWSKRAHEQFEKFFPNEEHEEFPSFEEWKKREEKREKEYEERDKKEEEEEKKREEEEEELDDVSTIIDSMGYYAADNPIEYDESGHTRDWSMKEIIDEIIDNKKDIVDGVKNLIKKYGVNETYKKLKEKTEAFTPYEIKRLVIRISKI